MASRWYNSARLNIWLQVQARRTTRYMVDLRGFLSGAYTESRAYDRWNLHVRSWDPLSNSESRLLTDLSFQHATCWDGTMGCLCQQTPWSIMLDLLVSHHGFWTRMVFSPGWLEARTAAVLLLHMIINGSLWAASHFACTLSPSSTAFCQCRAWCGLLFLLKRNIS